jgi:hypothetical protein
LGLLTRSQQEHVVAELSGHSVRCILTVPSLQKTFDRGQVAAHPPLLRYIENNFNPVAARAPYALLKRKRG